MINGGICAAFGKLDGYIVAWLQLAGSGDALVPHPNERVAAAQGILGREQHRLVIKGLETLLLALHGTCHGIAHALHHALQMGALVGQEVIGGKGDVPGMVIKPDAVGIDDASSDSGNEAVVIGQMFPGSGNRVTDGTGNGLLQLVEAGQCVGATLDEPLGSGSGRFDPNSRHIIEHRHVTLMTDTHNDRQGEIGHVRGQIVVVKRVEFGCRTTATDDDHTVKLVDVAVDAV